MEIFDKDRCCGCTACIFVCPTNALELVEDIEGFFYPKLKKELCINCGKCKNVCAFNKNKKVDRQPLVFAARYKEREILSFSQSGGAFVALSNAILEEEGIVYGCILDEKFNAIHTSADNKKQRDMMRGSKYVQSNLKNTFKEIKEILSNNEKIMFVGTPCQVSGLREYIGEQENIIYVDLLCHGVPSPKIWREHLEFLKQKSGKFQKKKEIKEIVFRDKLKHRWEESIIRLKIEKKEYFDRLFSGLFYSNYTLRPACYNCPYKKDNLRGDITIADFWGIDKILPDFYDKKGTSLVLVHNERGKKLFNNAKKYLDYRQVYNQDWMNFQMKEAATKPNNREQFWEDFQIRGYNYILKKYMKNTIWGNFKRNIKGAIYKMNFLIRDMKRGK